MGFSPATRLVVENTSLPRHHWDVQNLHAAWPRAKGCVKGVLMMISDDNNIRDNDNDQINDDDMF